MPEPFRATLAPEYDNEHGSALVIVLIIATILLLGTLWASSLYRTGVSMTGMLKQKLQARLAAESGLQLLLYYGTTGIFHTASLANQLPLTTGMPSVLPIDGTESAWSTGTAEVTFTLQDTGGLLNGWMLNPQAIVNYLLRTGTDRSTAVTAAQSLQDWLDTNDLHHENGAERWYYRADRKFAYQPRNDRSLQAVEEISLVRGFGPDVWRRLRPLITLSPAPTSNLQTMPVPVLMAWLDIDRQTAQSLTSMRRQGVWLTPASVSAVTGKRITGFQEGISSLPSRVLEVRIHVRQDEAAETWQGTISFRPTRNRPFTIIRWQEGS